jgi:hypothetical protein
MQDATLTSYLAHNQIAGHDESRPTDATAPSVERVLRKGSPM